MRYLPPLLLTLLVLACGASLPFTHLVSTDLSLILAAVVGLLFGLFGILPRSESDCRTTTASTFKNNELVRSQEPRERENAREQRTAPQEMAQPAATGSYPSRVEIGLLLLILALGSFLRLHDLHSLPYGVWFDEAQNILVSKRILADPSYRPVFVPDLSQLPALPFYYYAMFIGLLGDNIFSLRLATSLIGIGAIFTTWLLSRELYGQRVALIAATLLAVSRWHMTFSRFGMANIFVTFFAPLVLYFFIRSQRKSSLRNGVIGGIALGCGLQTYYSFLAFPVLLIGVYTVRALTKYRTSLLAMLVLFVTAAAVYSPVGVYAYRNWDAFSQRIQTVATISPRDVLTLAFDRSEGARDKIQQLRYTCMRHIRMFHYFGDNNGRHNLPGKPMLDPISGTLLVVGAVLILFRLFDWRSALLIGSSALFISAGIFSIPIEAPQAARTLGLTPFLAILCALPFGALPLSHNRSWFAYASALIGCCLVIASGALAILMFHEQLQAPSVWAEFSAAQTRIAEITREAKKGTRVSAPERLSGGPTIDLIANPSIPIIPFHPSNLIPLPCSYSDFVYTFTPEQRPWLELAQRIYPEATRKTLHTPTSEDPLLYELYVSQDSVRRICLAQTELNNHPLVWIRTRNASGSQATTHTLPEGLVLLSPAKVHELEDALLLNDVYPATIPVGGLTATEHSLPRNETVAPFSENYPLPDWHFHELHTAAPFTVTWSGTLHIENPGVYELLLQVQDKGSLTLDGIPRLRLKQPGVRITSAHLTAGTHSVEISMQALTGYFMASWQWRPPGHEGFSVVRSELLRPLPVNTGELKKASEDVQ